MKIKKKKWGCLLSLLCIFMLVLPVMASESPETDSEVSAVTSEESAVPTENPAIPAERQKPLLVDEAGLLTEEESRRDKGEAGGSVRPLRLYCPRRP